MNPFVNAVIAEIFLAFLPLTVFSFASFDRKRMFADPEREVTAD